MLEKIGLPPKPALKGNEWVLDASHCQGCSSAFTFFNRKHHCRRCGGIFCGNCTQQRITLRGQGEGPVRICDPCKKLEEAARFESRYGHRSKVSKVAGSSKSNSSIDSDPLLKELLGHDLDTNSTELMDDVNNLIAPKHARSISTGDLVKAGNDRIPSTQVTPEMLLLQAQEEKKQWLALKKEGKGEEALHAFKRGKELERQAENLKLSLRRSQRKATTLTSRKEKQEEINKLEPRQRTADSISGNTQDQRDYGVIQTKAKGTGLKEHKEKKDDLMDALKEIGWIDADLEDTGGKKSKPKTVENELAELAAAVHQGNNSHRQTSTSSMEVLAHKRRALALKREGHLAEAKEELKKAKLMERQLEEQQMFGGEDEESDEELSALIRGMDKESFNHNLGDIDMDFSILGDIGHEEDERVEVTDVDMDDPEMVAALRSMGWEEEAAEMEKTFQRPVKPSNSSHDYSTSFHGVRKLQNPAAEHVDFLGSMEASFDDVEATEDDMKDPFFLSALKAMGFEEEETSKLTGPSIPDFKDMKRLQQEVLFLKKEALVLKRAGKLQEAKEELHQAKQLEKKLKHWESQNNEEDVLAAFSVQQPSHNHEAKANMLQQTVFPLDKDTDDVDVTEEDMCDPELAKTLKSLGWQDDHESEDFLDTKKEAEPYERSFIATHKSKTKSELQKELLGVKRAALKLRREGKGEEAEEELKKAHILEQLLEESGRVSSVNKEAKHTSEQTADRISNTEKIVKVSKPGTEDPTVLALKIAEFKTDGESLKLSLSPIHTTKHTEKPCDKINNVHREFLEDGWQSSLSMEVKSQKPSGTSSVTTGLSSIPDIIPSERTEIALEGEGNLPSTTFVQTAVSEKVSPHTANITSQVKEPLDFVTDQSSSFDKEQDTPAAVKLLTETAVSSIKASQQQVLALKRQALALKREGRQTEAKEKLKEAKSLEVKLASENTQFESPALDVVQLPGKKAEEDTLPSAISAAASSKQARTHPSSAVQKSTAGKDRMKLQQESLAHKRKALALRREGNTEAADMEFEIAKSIEKQMEELGGITEGHSAMPREDDVGSIDDVFDPQLLAALKGLGWKESDIVRPTPEARQEAVEKPQEGNRKKSTEAISGPSRSKQNDEREQIEEKIKSERIRAVQLKRSGQQSEALNVLRGVKLLEKKLQSMS